MTYSFKKSLISISMLTLAFSFFLFSSVSVSAQNKEEGLNKYPKCSNFAEVCKLIGYPEEAKKKQIEGQVFLKVLVDTQGKVKDSEILKDPNELLAEAVKAQVDHLRFTPGEKDGKLVSTWVTIPFNFKFTE